MLSSQQEGASRADGDGMIGRPPTGLPPRLPMSFNYQDGAAEDERGIASLPTSRQRRVMNSPRSQPPALHLFATPAPRLLPPEPDVARPQQADDPVLGAGRATSENHPARMLHPDRQASVSASALLENAGDPRLRVTSDPLARALRSDRQASAAATLESAGDPSLRATSENPATRVLRSDRQVVATAILGSTSDPALARAQQADNLARSVLQTSPENPSARVLRSERQAPATAILAIASDLSSLTRPPPLAAESLARQRVDARAADVGYFEEARTQRDSRMRHNQAAGTLLQSASPEMRLSYEADPVAAWQFDQIRRDDFRTSN